MSNYLNQLEDLTKIYYCIGLAETKLTLSFGHYKAYGSYHLKKRYQRRMEILTASILRLKERQSKIIINLYKQKVTKTQ